MLEDIDLHEKPAIGPLPLDSDNVEEESAHESLRVSYTYHLSSNPGSNTFGTTREVQSICCGKLCR